MRLKYLVIIVGLIPVLTGVYDLMAGTALSERHHLHHDTYSVTPVLSRTLVLVMAFMGVLGIVTGWLCHLGVFAADPVVPMAFFISFELAMMLLIVAMLRYRVVVYDDHMVVRHALRAPTIIRYGDIGQMGWVPSIVDPHLHDLIIHTRSKSDVRILGLVDIEQMLLRIDRYDVLSPS